jgi:ABC-type lipoprotein export system ATPase subunit
MTDVVLTVTDVSKDFHSLRPLRIKQLELGSTDTTAILGLDRAAAEVLVNMISGATLPDQGELVVFGGSTRAITSTDAWFSTLDRIGILSERMVLVEELTVGQNLALPLSLEVETMPPDVRDRVQRLAAEAGISSADAARPMGAVSPAAKMRTRLGKALALDPQILVAEHANASLPADEAAVLAGDLAAIAKRRGIALLVLTADSAFASAACRRVLALQPATGELAPISTWRRWFGGA